MGISGRPKGRSSGSIDAVVPKLRSPGSFPEMGQLIIVRHCHEPIFTYNSACSLARSCLLDAWNGCMYVLRPG